MDFFYGKYNFVWNLSRSFFTEFFRKTLQEIYYPLCKHKILQNVPFYVFIFKFYHGILEGDNSVEIMMFIMVKKDFHTEILCINISILHKIFILRGYVSILCMNFFLILGFTI